MDLSIKYYNETIPTCKINATIGMDTCVVEFYYTCFNDLRRARKRSFQVGRATNSILNYIYDN
ncbi:MAG: hypothetical protein ACTSWN_14110 [Promethearchaeota archaeon]